MNNGMYGPWVVQPQPPQQPQVILMQMPGGDKPPPRQSRPPRGGRGNSTKLDGRLSFKQMKKLRKKMNEYIKELEEEKKGGEKKDEKKEDTKKKGMKDKTFNWVEMFGLLCVFGLPVGTGMLLMIKACAMLIKTF